MRVKIIKVTKPTYWYAKHIGKVFNVIDRFAREYVIASDYERPAAPWRHILKADAEAVQ